MPGKYKLLNIVNAYIEHLRGTPLEEGQYDELIRLLEVPENMPYHGNCIAAEHVYDSTATREVVYFEFDYGQVGVPDGPYTNGLTRFVVENSIHTIPAVDRALHPVSMEAAEEIARFVYINMYLAYEEVEGGK